MYWGYNVRVAQKFEDIFDECPHESGYDLKIGISEKGDIADFANFSTFSNFKHALVIFGGLEGIEGILEQDERTKIKKESMR